ncbi:hypothetical protein G6L37_34660 [Agrobacterium rubi]|nr:hypothetical protein [Agrobacterium rubi]NTF23710.1 hypothetical protein [Agrobacterium rubi]
MIDLDSTTYKLVRHTLVALVRKVPYGPSRDALLKDAGEFRREAAQANWKVNDIVLNELYTHNVQSAADDAALLEIRERERELRDQADQLGWRYELYALAAAGRYPQPGDMTVDNFAESIIEDIRTFQTSGCSTATCALKDVSEAVSSYLEAEGIALNDIILPPTLDELIDAGAEKPEHVDQDRWDRAVKAYYHQMTLDNTPDDFINGGSDYDEHFGDHDFDDEDEYAEEDAPAVAVR